MARPEPAFWVFAGDFARTPVGSWFGGNPTGAAGASIDAEEALVRCLGEVAERYSALTHPVEGVVQPVDPVTMTMFPRCAADENCSAILRGAIPEGPVTHVTMTRLACGGSLRVPAGYVHLSTGTPNEPVMTTPISSGLAFDPSLTKALFRGICEVAERDALMMTWWQRRRVPEIDLGHVAGNPPPDVSFALAERLARVSAVSMRPRFFDITTDFCVPTVACVLMAPSFPYLTVGAACRDSADAACAKALDEAVAVRLAMHGAEDFTPPSLDEFSWLHELEDHAKLYAAGYLRHAFDFLLDGGQDQIRIAEVDERRKWSIPQTAEHLQGLAEDLEQSGLTVLWTDLTAPELCGQGYVVKVVIPQMIPLPQLHNVRWLGTQRLNGADTSSRRLSTSFNPYPHPFA